MTPSVQISHSRWKIVIITRRIAFTKYMQKVNKVISLSKQKHVWRDPVSEGAFLWSTHILLDKFQPRTVVYLGISKQIRIMIKEIFEKVTVTLIWHCIVNCSHWQWKYGRLVLGDRPFRSVEVWPKFDRAFLYLIAS